MNCSFKDKRRHEHFVAIANINHRVVFDGDSGGKGRSEKQQQLTAPDNAPI